MPKRIYSLATMVFCCCLVVGCNNSHAGNWGADKVQEELMTRMEFTEMSLQPTADGFTGTGKVESGETFEITVSQNAADRKFDYVLKGDRGTTEEGFVQN